MSVTICELVIQKQGEVHLAALHTDRWCLTADCQRVMVCDPTPWSVSAHVQTYRENSPEGRKQTGKRTRGKRHVAKKIFDIRCGSSPLPGQARGVLSGVHVSETSGALSGSLGSARPHTHYIIDPLSPTCHPRLRNSTYAGTKPVELQLQDATSTPSFRVKSMEGSRCQASQPVWSREVPQHSPPTTNNLFPSPTPSHQDTPPPQNNQ